MTTVVGEFPWQLGVLPGGPWRAFGVWGYGPSLDVRLGRGVAGRFRLLGPSPTAPSALADEPTSPSIDLQAKHVPASAVVSSAMNSAPVLGTSPSSPTFTFALGRHYSQDCSECFPQPPSQPLPCRLVPLVPVGPAA